MISKAVSSFCIDGTFKTRVLIAGLIGQFFQALQNFEGGVRPVQGIKMDAGSHLLKQVLALIGGMIDA